MTIYVDTSALLKLYLDEPDSDAAESLLAADPDWLTARHTAVEVRRNLARALQGAALARGRDYFRRDWQTMAIVELDETTCEIAASLAEELGARTLDALHLAAAQRVGGGALPFATFDVRQARPRARLGGPCWGRDGAAVQRAAAWHH